MNALRILILCVTAAMVCASIRTLHPQIASAVALAAGLAALMLSLQDIRLLSDAALAVEKLLPQTTGDRYFLLRLCGIALLSEFASDICTDSGETALAKRIEMGTKLALLAACLPMTTELIEMISRVLA